MTTSNKLVKVYGLAGTNGAGKDTVGEVLAEYGYYVESATDMLAEELRSKKWPLDREHKRKLSAEWRRQFGMGAVVDRAYKIYRVVEKKYQGFAVGSLRHPGEVDKIHALGGLVIWVDADPKVRYDRINSAKTRNNKENEDAVTYDEFLAQQEIEMHPTGDNATLNISGVKKKADIFLMNNGDDIELFKQDVIKALGLNC